MSAPGRAGRIPCLRLWPHWLQLPCWLPHLSAVSPCPRAMAPWPSWNHRIIELYNSLIAGLERTLKGQLAQPPCNKQGHLQLEDVAHIPIQPDLEYFQQWDIHYLFGQLILEFYNLHFKSCFLTSNLNISSFSFKPLLGLITAESSSRSSITSPYV